MLALLRARGLEPGGSDGSLEQTESMVLRLTKRCTERHFARLRNLPYLCLLLLYCSSILTGFHREPTVPSNFRSTLGSISRVPVTESRGEPCQFGIEPSRAEEMQHGGRQSGDDQDYEEDARPELDAASQSEVEEPGDSDEEPQAIASAEQSEPGLGQIVGVELRHLFGTDEVVLHRTSHAHLVARTVSTHELAERVVLSAHPAGGHVPRTDHKGALLQRYG